MIYVWIGLTLACLAAGLVGLFRPFKYGFWFTVARWVPQILRYHVVIMCTADYSTESDYVDEVHLIKSMDVAKWLER